MKLKDLIKVYEGEMSVRDTFSWDVIADIETECGKSVEKVDDALLNFVVDRIYRGVDKITVYVYVMEE